MHLKFLSKEDERDGKETENEKEHEEEKEKENERKRKGEREREKKRENVFLSSVGCRIISRKNAGIPNPSNKPNKVFCSHSWSSCLKICSGVVL